VHLAIEEMSVKLAVRVRMVHLDVVVEPAFMEQWGSWASQVNLANLGKLDPKVYLVYLERWAGLGYLAWMANLGSRAWMVCQARTEQLASRVGKVVQATQARRVCQDLQGSKEREV
jgi:hypothetical protein